MAISQGQIDLIQRAHALGCLDPAIAVHAGVSLSTVKRYRSKLGLKTNCPTALRGEEGEQLTFNEARRRGLDAYWRAIHNEKHDLFINGRRVDAKASMRLADGSWRFRLPAERSSFYGEYFYAKDYAADCEVIALVALYPEGRAPDFYLLESRNLPADVRIRLGGPSDALRNDWSLLEFPGPGLQA
ncbi:hypothetical protein [Deinococcus phoenicis]|uniref:hypothetical protein n=1 Tax=Deinococcus phoenicis TaxID=1476583 RepID=UPI000558BE57|nr:hypothetical protein [Deinococcus phoenicis]